MNTDVDIAVIGGGPNGATTAALLARHSGVAPARIALLAPELARAPASCGTRGAAGASAPPDLRVAAISRASEQVLRHAGAWSELPSERLCAYEYMRIWHQSAPSAGPGTLVFSAAELAEPNLGFIVENRALSGAGLASFRAQGGCTLGESVDALQVDGGAARLRTSSGA